MKDFLEEIPLDELRRITEKLAKECDNAKEVSEAAKKAWEKASDKHYIYERMLRFRMQQLEEKSESRAIPKVEEELDKTALILDSVQRGGAKGITPKEIEDTLLASGVDLKQGYVHAILSRLKRRGKVRAENRRYFSVENRMTNE